MSHEKIIQYIEQVRAEFAAYEDGLICRMEMLQAVEMRTTKEIIQLCECNPDCAVDGTNNCADCRNRVLNATIPELIHLR